MLRQVTTAMGMGPVWEAARLSTPYTGEQTAADHDMYGFTSPAERKPAPQLSQGELGIADRLNWDMDHTTQSSYTPTEYVRPWEVEGWGSGDVATTPPTRLQTAQEQIDAQPILPQRPGFRPGQRDYEYMPTEKEQRRERAANIATLARERGTRWQDIPLPGGRPAPEPTYGRWQDAELPNWQPVPDRHRGNRPDLDPTVYTGGSRDFDKRGKSTTPIQIPKEIQYDDGRFPVKIQPVPEDEIVWSGGSRDFDERTGTYRPGHRGFEGGWTPPGSDVSDTGTPGTGTIPPRKIGPKPVGRPKGWEDAPIGKRGPARRSRAFDVRDTWRTPRSGSGISTSSTRNLDDRGIMTDRMRYYRR